MDADEVAPGTLFIISGASGTGKSSLVASLVATEPAVRASISHTTRPKRAAEKHGVDYHFIDVARFQTMAEEGLFLEYAQVFDHYYGTSRDWVMQRLHAGTDVVLEIDWQGARQVRAQIPQSVGIFILPPSRPALETRLRGRKQDTPEIIERRLREATRDMSHFEEFDYLIINDNFALALNELRVVILAQRLQCSRQAVRHRPLLAKLLESPSGFQ